MHKYGNADGYKHFSLSKMISPGFSFSVVKSARSWKRNTQLKAQCVETRPQKRKRMRNKRPYPYATNVSSCCSSPLEFENRMSLRKVKDGLLYTVGVEPKFSLVVRRKNVWLCSKKRCLIDFFFWISCRGSWADTSW